MDVWRQGDDTTTKLYKAAMEGCVLTLNSLIQKDPLILSKISLTTFNETPLHISALLGHLNFTKQLLTHKPKLASELDSHSRSPLHLASAEGHAEIVQALLQEIIVDNVDHDHMNVCLAKDEDGRIPLHYAAMRGRADVIKLLVRAQPSLIFEATPVGETVMHVCVRYNHLEALKVLVESVGYHNQNNREFLNLKDQAHGNTILHLAVMLKQIETVKYLLSLPEVRSGAETTVNYKGLKARDLLVHDDEYFPRDFKTLRLQGIFMEADRRTSKQEEHYQSNDSHKQLAISSKRKKKPKSCFFLARWWRKLTKYMKYKGDWMDDKRGSLMVVATVIGTVTFATAVNPPGNVWGETTTNSTRGVFSCSPEEPCFAGTAVMARYEPDTFLLFSVCNSVSFLASMSAILLLVSGFPIKNKICVCLLTVSMCGALTCMAFAFMVAMSLTMPSNMVPQYYHLYSILIFSWLALLLILCLFHTIRLLVWLVRKMWRCCRPKKKKKTLATDHDFKQLNHF